MSISALTSEAARLLAYYQGAEASINAQVAAAVAAVPSQVKTYYVDAINGADTNVGTSAAPFRTLNKALSVLNNTSGIYARLYFAGPSEYTFDRDCTIHNSSVDFLDWGGTNPSLRMVHRLISFEESSTNGTFRFSGRGISVNVNGVNLIQDEIPAEYSGLEKYVHQGIIAQGAGGVIRIANCNVTISDLPVAQLSSGGAAFALSSVSVAVTGQAPVLLHIDGGPVIVTLSNITIPGGHTLNSLITGRTYAAAGHPMSFISNYDFGGA